MLSCQLYDQRFCPSCVNSKIITFVHLPHHSHKCCTQHAKSEIRPLYRLALAREGQIVPPPLCHSPDGMVSGIVYFLLPCSCTASSHPFWVNALPRSALAERSNETKGLGSTSSWQAEVLTTPVPKFNYYYQQQQQ